MRPDLMAIAALRIPLTLSSQARNYPLASSTGLRLHNVVAEPATLDGKKGAAEERVRAAGGKIVKPILDAAGEPREQRWIAELAEGR